MNIAHELKEMEKKAAELEKSDPKESMDIYRQAAEKWKKMGANAFCSSGYLRCQRKAGQDRAKLVVTAKELVVKFEKDPWIASTYGWICHDSAKEAARAASVEECLLYIKEAVKMVCIIKDPSLLCERLLTILSSCAKNLKEKSPREQEMGFELLRNFIKSQFDNAVEHLRDDGDSNNQPPLKLYYYLVRKLFTYSKDFEAIEYFMEQAVNKYPDDPWFTESKITTATALGKLEKAEQYAKEAMERLPEAWAPAAAYADMLIQEGRTKQAIRVLKNACETNKQPWPWQRLAVMLKEEGRNDEADLALKIALSYIRQNEFAISWKMHHQRAEIAALQNNKEETAIETYLAQEARKAGGWGLSKEQRRFLGEYQSKIESEIRRLKDQDYKTVLKQMYPKYLNAKKEWMEKTAVPAVVINIEKENRYGFAKDQNGRSIYIGRELLTGNIEKGKQIKIAVVQTIDKKKGKKAWKAVWIGCEQNK